MKSNAKFEEKLTCGLTLMESFDPKQKMYELKIYRGIILKFTEKLYVMTMKNDAQFGQKLASRF